MNKPFLTDIVWKENKGYNWQVTFQIMTWQAESNKRIEKGHPDKSQLSWGDFTVQNSLADPDLTWSEPVRTN